MNAVENANADVQAGAAAVVMFLCSQALHLFTEATVARIDAAEVAAEFLLTRSMMAKVLFFSSGSESLTERLRSQAPALCVLHALGLSYLIFHAYFSVWP